MGEMTKTAQALLNEALELTPGERVDLAEGLFASLGRAPGLLDLEQPGWDEAMERRAQEMENPNTGSSWAEVRARIESSLSES